MLQTIAVIAAIAVLASRYAKINALQAKAENKAIENNYYALLERKEFATEAQTQDAEVYKIAVKIAKR